MRGRDKTNPKGFSLLRIIQYPIMWVSCDQHTQSPTHSFIHSFIYSFFLVSFILLWDWGDTYDLDKIIDKILRKNYSLGVLPHTWLSDSVLYPRNLRRVKGCGLIHKRRACLESKRERGGEGGREWERLYLAIGLSQCYHGFKFHAFCDILFSHKNFSQILHAN